MPDRDEPSFQQRFDDATRQERDRAEGLRIPFQLDPRFEADFSRAMGNVDRLVAAIVNHEVDPYAAAARIPGQMLPHMPHVKDAGGLYVMWAELTDLVELSNGDREEAAAVVLLRRAASEWNDRPGRGESVAQYLSRWEDVRQAWNPE